MAEGMFHITIAFLIGVVIGTHVINRCQGRGEEEKWVPPPPQDHIDGV